ncbi:MAG: ATP-binding protein [Bacteroidia bacterium]
MTTAVKKKQITPRDCMEMAIEEMKKSLNEPRPDGKVPPKVGALVLFPDGKIEVAHRGELREGDHAEFTLLERKLAHQKLDNCILFTTLEPCVERNSPKVPCCRRTSNARIKTVYVGIEDPDPTVDGKGIKHLEDHNIKVIMFDRDLQKIIEDENAKFREQAITRKNFIEEENYAMTPLELPVPETDFKELSKDALQKFINEASLNYKIEQLQFKKYLSDLGALALDEKTNTYKPTGVGILLFGINPRLKFKQAVLKAHVNYGSDKIEPVNFDQPLVLIPDLIEDWLKKALPLSKNTNSFKRKDIADFPMDVLREAVINAIAHRDYNEEGAKSSLEIDNDKIVVKSPGAPLPSISLEQLNAFNAPSISRNPIITYVFNLMGYVEETGFGMRALKSLNEKHGLPLPEYNFHRPFLTLTFPRSMKAVQKVTNKKVLSNLTDDEIEGYELVKGRGDVSTKEYAEHFNLSQRSATRHLSNMYKLKLIDTNGENLKSPKLRYIIKQKSVKYEA